MRIFYRNGNAVRCLQESALSDNYAETGLPVNIWLDTDASYREEFVGKTIRFQGDTNEEFNPRNLFRMTISRDCPMLFENERDKIELPDDVIEAVREFVIENARILEMPADEKLTVQMFAAKMKPVEFYGAEQSEDEAPVLPVRFNEMATSCHPKDNCGKYPMWIRIEYTNGEHSPPHAHLYKPDQRPSPKSLITKFLITANAPAKAQEIQVVRGKPAVPKNYADLIVKWAKGKDKYGINNWTGLRRDWDGLEKTFK